MKIITPFTESKKRFRVMMGTGSATCGAKYSKLQRARNFISGDSHYEIFKLIRVTV